MSELRPPLPLIAAALDSITAHVAILDDSGKIFYVNHAWKRFADENAYGKTNYGLGLNYIELAEGCRGPGCEQANRVAAGMRQVLLGELDEFRHEYPCHGPRHKHWFQLRVTLFGAEEGKRYLMVVHENVTEIKAAEERAQKLNERIASEQEARNAAMLNTVSALSRSIELRDPYTNGHQQRVSELAEAIAMKMGLDEDVREGIRMGGLIHDVGKLYVPSELLSMPRKLTDIEFQLIKMHASMGGDILEGQQFPWPLKRIITQHHERLDGSGYPKGLKGDEICLEAQIVAVADVVEAMSSHRPYRPSLGFARARKEIETGRGRVYNPEAVDACLQVMEDLWEHESSEEVFARIGGQIR